MAANAAADAAIVTVAARLDRLPPSRHTRKLITLLSLGAWFEFYDLFFPAYVAIGLFKEGLFKPTTSGLFDLQGFASLIASGFAGMFVGTLAFSWLSDHLGRRSIFTFALLWYSIGAFIMAFQTTPQTIDLWRFIACIGLGVELVNVDAYLSELVPKEQRGSAFAFNQSVMYTAVPVIAFLAWQLVPRQSRALGLALGGDHRLGRRAGDLVDPPQSAGIAALAGAAGPLGGSRRHRRQHGAPHQRGNRPRIAAARAVAGETEERRGAWIEMWSEAYRGRTIMLVAFQLLQTIGYYGLNNWVPTLLISQGIGVTKSLQYTFAIALAAPIGPLIGYFFADRFERKWQVAGSALGIAALGFLFAQQTAALGVIACGFVLTLCANCFSFSFHAYQSELYPTRIRAQAIGFVYSWSRFSAIFSGFIIAFFLGNYGIIGVFSLIASAMIAVFIVIGFFGPPVTKRRLEVIAA